MSTGGSGAGVFTPFFFFPGINLNISLRPGRARLTSDCNREGEY